MKVDLTKWRPLKDGEIIEEGDCYLEQCGMRLYEYVIGEKLVIYPSAPSYRPINTALSTQEGGDHYTRFAIQPVTFCHKNKLGAIESNIVKYACRHGEKGGAEDVKKIVHYAKMLLELEYGGES